MGAVSVLEWRRSGGISWLAWEGVGVAAAFPDRGGGVSPAPYDTLNLGLTTDDEEWHVVENRRRFCAAVGVPPEVLVVPGQVHGAALAWVGSSDAGRGALSHHSAIARHDGLLTAASGLGLGVSYADCVPVVIAARGEEGSLLAVVHAGWRGMLAGIVGRAAAALAGRGRLDAAAVGPSIGPCCFVADDVLRARFAARFPAAVGGSTVDLWACARAQLEDAGLPAASIVIAGLCTACDRRFYSHRRDAGATGRHLAVAWRQEA